MFDIYKDLGGELVLMEQAINSKDPNLLLKISVDVEVSKRVKDKDFPHYLSVSIAPTMRNYLTDTSLSLDKKYIAANYVLFTCIFAYLENLASLNKKELTLLSTHMDKENLEEIISKDFIDKKEDVNLVLPVMKYALALHTSYKAAIGDVSITSNHMNTFKMMTGKAYLDSIYGKNAPSGNSSSEAGKAGCYIATAIYQSYDCKEVYLLRRYRDYYLKNHFFGRMFIKLYYFFSPKMVKLFGKSKLFRKIFLPFLNKKVDKLIKEGYSYLPYND